MLTSAIPRFLSAISSSWSPGWMLNSSRAPFGMTICPFSPTLTRLTNFPFGNYIGIKIPPATSYTWYEKLYQV